MKKTVALILVFTLALSCAFLCSGCYDETKNFFLSDYMLDAITLQSAVDATFALSDFVVRRESNNGIYEEYRVKIEYATDPTTNTDFIYNLKGYHYKVVTSETETSVEDEHWRSNDSKYTILNDTISLDTTVVLADSGYDKIMETMINPATGVVALDFLKARIGEEQTVFYVDSTYEEKSSKYLNEVTSTMYFTMSDEDMSNVGRTAYSTIVTIKFKVNPQGVGPINYIYIDEFYTEGVGANAVEINNVYTFTINSPANIDWTDFAAVELDEKKEE